MIVLDASVLIAELDSNDAHHEQAHAMLVECASDELAMSVVNLAEVMVGPARMGRLDELRGLLQGLGVESIGIGAHLAPALAELRSRTGLRMPDCCAIVTALEARAPLATFDRQLAAQARSCGLHVVAAPA